ncbi:MAG: glycosyltransferase family 61 protein [Synergistaceae bacterium]|nr:glycosyltransferase family 61 protein [Synergistaceae bacterium]
MAVTIDQTRPDQPNYDLLYDKEYYTKSLNTEHLIAGKKLSYRIIEDGYILPLLAHVNEGGIFSSEGDYVSGSSYKEGPGDFSDEINNRTITLKAAAELHGIDPTDVISENSTVVYLGMFFKVWGHLITDNMRLLWFLHSNDYAEKFSQCKLIYCPVMDFKLEGNYKRMLEILGIDCSKLTPVTRLSRYSRIILPDECFFKNDAGIRFFTPEYVSTIDAVRDYAASIARPGTPEKIYYSYSSYKSGKTFGEDKLERYFASKGYAIIHPERLTLDEQLTLLAGCKSFASTIGSCAHNMIFLRDGAEVILIPRANYFAAYQPVLDQVHRLNIHYVDSSFSIFVGKRPWGGPHLYFISSNLRRYFHDEDTSPIIDVSDFMRYMNAHTTDSNPETYKYYSVIAAEYFGGLCALRRSKTIRERLKRIPGLRKAVRAVKRLLGILRE